MVVDVAQWWSVVMVTVYWYTIETEAHCSWYTLTIWRAGTWWWRVVMVW